VAVSRETELYLPVKNFFAARGYEVKAEVRGCDLVAVHPQEPEITIVEMKRIFTLPLLLQGTDRQKTGALVWLAVERNRAKRGAHNQRYYELTALCRRLRLGLLTVTFYKTKSPVVEVWCEPGIAVAGVAGTAEAAALVAAETAAAYGSDADAAPIERRSRKAADRLRREFEARSGDFNVGGSTRRKLVTAYRERALQCALALHCHGPSAPRQVRDWTGCANPGTLLRDNVYGWFARVEKGVYRLTPAGIRALDEYREVTDMWASRLPWAGNWEARAQSGADHRLP